MVFFNHATRQMTAKIVYYGPGLCGKTTNLNTIYGKTTKQARGEMVSLNTETDRTLFFDLLPMDVGTVSGFKTKLQLYTVPGQVFYNSTRKLVLKGVDGIVFVVDSQTPMLDACKESFQNMQDNLRELGLDIKDIPLVFQWNKRDLRNIVTVEDLEAHFNPKGTPSFQAVASDGNGVFETLRGITKLVLTHLKTNVLGEGAGKPAAPAPAPPPPPPPPPAPKPAAPLALSDLPSVSDVLDLNTGLVNAALDQPGESTDTGLHIEAPDLPEPPAPRPSLLALAPAPLPEVEETEVPAPPPPPPAPKVEAPAPPPPPPPLPPPPPPPKPTTPFALPAPKAPAPKPKVLDKGAIDSLLGELTMVGKLGAPSILKFELPADLDGEIEVVVQIKSGGVVQAEQSLHRPAPKKGITAKLSVELKKP